MTNKDNYGMIGPKMRKAINAKLFEYGAHKGLQKDFASFLKEEKECSKDVNKLLGFYQKVLIQDGVFAFFQGQPVDAELVKMYSERVRRIVQFAFTAGMLYGKSRMSDLDWAESVTAQAAKQETDELDERIAEEGSGETPLDTLKKLLGESADTNQFFKEEFDFNDEEEDGEQKKDR